MCSLGPKPERCRALLFSLGFFFFIVFFYIDYSGILWEGSAWTKTLENLHTHWNLRQLGRRRSWDPGVAQSLYGAPWNTTRKLRNSSHILARIHMKLGTHIDLIEPNTFAAHVMGAPNSSRLPGILKSTCSGI